jgi:hypothetical protein
MAPEVLVSGRWVPIDARPSVVEDALIRLRGLDRGAEVCLGEVKVGPHDPDRPFRLSDFDDLRSHAGILSVACAGELLGEIDVVPGKLSMEAWRSLRADLEQTWTGLLFDPASATSLPADGPDPRILWSRLRHVVTDLSDRPVEVLSTGTRWVRQDRVRSGGQYNAAVARASLCGRPGRTRGLVTTIAEPERALVRDCLVRLHALAHRRVDAHDVVDAVGRFLSSGLFAAPSRAAVSVTHLARHEPRLRQVVAVRQELVHSHVVVTEGPGALRLGVKGLDRLYEYWVFLQVLRSLRRALGEPLAPAFEVLGTRLSGQRMRLEIPPGTEVEFPGGVVAVFTPTLTSNSHRSWRGLEVVAPPVGSGQIGHDFVTPDVVVLRQGETDEVVVIDAKYRARHAIDGALWQVHQKYGRLRRHGVGVAREVLVLHPQPGLKLSWAGHRAVPGVPGIGLDGELWPDDWVAKNGPDVTDRPPARGSSVDPSIAGLEDFTEAEMVLCDQEWTARAVGSRRIDMRALRDQFGSASSCHLVGSARGPRASFQYAAMLRGWRVAVAEHRHEVLAECLRIVDDESPRSVLLIGADPILRRELEARCPSVIAIDDAERLPESIFLGG